MSTPNLPPGPFKLPLIGNIHQLVGDIPHRALRDMAKKYGPLMHLKLGEVSTIVVSSAETAQEVMKTHDITFASRPHILVTNILTYDSADLAFAPYGDYWRQMRKICMLELLSMKRVQSFRAIREEEVSNLMESISCKVGSPVNLTELIFPMTYSITSRAAFGKKNNDQETFLVAVKEIVDLASGFSVSDLFPSIDLLQVLSGARPRLEKVHKEIDRMFESIICDHKARRLAATSDGEGAAHEDLVDVLLNVQEEGGGDLQSHISTKNIKAVILDIFFAGSETSSTVVDWAMVEMVKNPRVMKKAQAEVRTLFDGKRKIDETEIQGLEYLKLVIKETMRLHPPFTLLLPRECREKCEIHGYDIPIKTKVIINAWAIGRDPKYWPEPESFNPERFLDSSIGYKGLDFEYLPFGAGRRICPGVAFGMMNVELPLAHFLYHFDWKLPNGTKPEDLDMTEAFGASVRRKQPLQLVPIPYHPI